MKVAKDSGSEILHRVRLFTGKVSLDAGRKCL